jgi:hypothetical protein
MHWHQHLHLHLHQHQHQHRHQHLPAHHSYLQLKAVEQEWWMAQGL